MKPTNERAARCAGGKTCFKGCCVCESQILTVSCLHSRESCSPSCVHAHLQEGQSRATDGVMRGGEQQ